MCCTGKETIVCDESSLDSNASMSLEYPDDLNMLYLLASAAEEASLERLHALATATELRTPSDTVNLAKCKKGSNEMAAVTEMAGTLVEKSGCDERRLFRMKCSFCCRCFSREENLRWHMKKHAKENGEVNTRMATCSPSLVPVQFVVEQTHQVVPTVPDSCGFWCVKCDKSFQREATFRVHMRFHTRRRVFSLPLACKKCAEMCSTKTQYLIHKKMHRMEKAFRRRTLIPEPAHC